MSATTTSSAAGATSAVGEPGASRNQSFRNSIRTQLKQYRGRPDDDNALNHSQNHQSHISTSNISPPVVNHDVAAMSYSYQQQQQQEQEQERQYQHHHRPQQQQQTTAVNNGPRSSQLTSQHRQHASKSSNSPLPLTPNIPLPIQNDNTKARNSVLKVPPMRNVWLDDEDEDENVPRSRLRQHNQPHAAQPQQYHYHLPQQNDQAPPRPGSRLGQRSTSTQDKRYSGVFSGLKRFSSQRKHNDASPPKSKHQHSGSKLSLSSISSNSTTNTNNSQSSSKRLFGMLSRQNSLHEPVSKSNISAPSNFIHANHIDAEYLKGSSSDNNMIQPTTQANVTPAEDTVAPAYKSGATVTLSRSTSLNTVSHGNTPSRPLHRHDSSLGSVMTESSKSTTRPISMASSVYNNCTPITSGSPSPALSNDRQSKMYQNTIHDSDSQNQLQSQMDKKRSIESFASWAVSTNSSADFLEQQRWLMYSMADDNNGATSENTAPSSYGDSWAKGYHHNPSSHACYAPQPQQQEQQLHHHPQQQQQQRLGNIPGSRQSILHHYQQEKQRAKRESALQWATQANPQAIKRASNLLPTPELPVTSLDSNYRNYNVPLTNPVSGASAAMSSFTMSSGQMLRHHRSANNLEQQYHQKPPPPPPVMAPAEETEFEWL